MDAPARTPSRLMLTVAFAISAMLLGIIGAVAAGTGPVAAPPKIAFVTTNANVAPDALTVGPMAGRLGAPLFITNKDNLGKSTEDALVAYGADLIIVAGGPNTVTDGVLDQIAAATGKAIAPENTAPASGIVRVYGDGRDETAVALSTLIANYNPKFLPTDATAADSELLDGKDSTAYRTRVARSIENGTTAITDGCDNYMSVSITVPTAGKIMVEADTTLRLRHTNGVATGAGIYIATGASTCLPEEINSKFFTAGTGLDASMPGGTNFFPLPISRLYSVTAGTHTYYLNGSAAGFGVSDTADFWYGALTATFTPTG